MLQKQQQSTDYQTVLDEVLMSPTTDDSHDMVFFKHMGKQLMDGEDWSWLLQCRNIILLRHPLEVLSSFYR